MDSKTDLECCDSRGSKPDHEDGGHSNQMNDDITSSGRIHPAPGVSVQFKKPLLPTVPGKGAARRSVGPEETPEKGEAVPPAKNRSGTSTENDFPVPYSEPRWSGLPSASYFFEVLKSGTIVEKYDLSKKSHFVFGRLGNCDIVMAHPTVSRFHAVMQYRAAAEDDRGPGFYIFDLGSTHGTFLNKNKLRPNAYVRVKVGHMIKIGMSSRNFILQGPPEDEEPESELGITELRELTRGIQVQAENKEKTGENHREGEEEEEEEEGIDWGMGEDADEDTDLSENPFAATQNEELYIGDPKKTLRGWFEREGHELEYHCEEKGFGQFVCRLELPVHDSKGLPAIAEAVVRGKKKEAVVQCALEACRILDRHGLLRQSTHESKKRKAKNWEDNDYYDSDEDTFLDRTGTVEKKRRLRMEQAGIKKREVHTYQSLIDRHERILGEIEKLESQIEEFGKKKKEEEEEEKTKEDHRDLDELDAYMSSLSKEGGDERSRSDAVRELKRRLVSLRQEEADVRRLADVAKPAELPPLSGPAGPPASRIGGDAKRKLPIIGKRRRTTQKPLRVFHVAAEEKKKRRRVDEGGRSSPEEETDDSDE